VRGDHPAARHSGLGVGWRGWAAAGATSGLFAGRDRP
jgi:hypothetical protein